MEKDLKYKIGNVKPNYVSRFDMYDRTWHIHRPVNEKGFKISEGWQLSLEGIPMALIDKDTKAKAMTYVKKSLKELYNMGILEDEIDITMRANRESYNL